MSRWVLLPLCSSSFCGLFHSTDLARDIKSFGGLEVNVNIIFEDDETNPDKGHAATLRLVQRGANVIINNVDKLCIGPNIAALESK